MGNVRFWQLKLLIGDNEILNESPNLVNSVEGLEKYGEKGNI
jgi:hypothetical protein